MCRTMAFNKRILSSVGNGPARRVLFGPVDREQLQEEYKSALQKELEEATQRWGFDFISEKPLDSSEYKWERVPGTKVPLVYRACLPRLGPVGGLRGVVATTKRGKAGSSQRDKENIPRTPERCAALNLETLEKTPEKRERKALKRQTNITDFYQAKRRVVGMPRKSGQ